MLLYRQNLKKMFSSFIRDGPVDPLILEGNLLGVVKEKDLLALGIDISILCGMVNFSKR